MTVAGEKAILIPDGKGGYIAIRLDGIVAGDRIIRVPTRNGAVAIRLSEVVEDDNVPAIPDYLGRHIAIQSSRETGYTLLNWEALSSKGYGPGTIGNALLIPNWGTTYGTIWDTGWIGGPFDFGDPTLVLSLNDEILAGPGLPAMSWVNISEGGTLYMICLVGYTQTSYEYHVYEDDPILLEAGSFRFSGSGPFPVEPEDYFYIDDEKMFAENVIPHPTREGIYDIVIAVGDRAQDGTTKVLHAQGAPLYRA